MMVLADSNILTALTKRNSREYPGVRHSLKVLRGQGDKVYLVPQNFIEFWSVATRPVDVNGLGLEPDKAALEIRKFKRYFNFLDDVPSIFAEWEALVKKHKVLGRNVHDARLVATMTAHQITHLLTFNGKDFKRFDEITVIDPNDL